MALEYLTRTILKKSFTREGDGWRSNWDAETQLLTIEVDHPEGDRAELFQIRGVGPRERAAAAIAFERALGMKNATGATIAPNRVAGDEALFRDRVSAALNCTFDRVEDNANGGDGRKGSEGN